MVLSSVVLCVHFNITYIDSYIIDLSYFQLCSSEEFWEQTVRLHCDTVTSGMEDLAKEVGWRIVFFTNKLQLQKQISRLKLKNETASADVSPSISGLRVDALSGLGDRNTASESGLK